jgi:hypothetical protein
MDYHGGRLIMIDADTLSCFVAIATCLFDIFKVSFLLKTINDIMKGMANSQTFLPIKKLVHASSLWIHFAVHY